MTKGLVVVLIALLAPMFLACAGGDDEPTATPKPQPSRRGNKLIEGEITFKGVESPISGAAVYVRLDDISVQDDAGKTIVEQVMRGVSVDPASPPALRYLIEHRELEPKDTYRIRVHVDSDDSGDVSEGDFARTVSYHAAMAVGTETLNAVDVVVEPVTIEPPEAAQAVLRVEAPLQAVDVSASPEDPDSYVLSITSLQPNACARPNGYQLSRRIRDEDSVVVKVYNVVPASPDVGCAQVLGMVEWNVAIGAQAETDAGTNVHINDRTFLLTSGASPKLDPADAEPPALRTLRGTIEFVGRTAPVSDATLYVRLEDLSRPDMGVRLVTERVIPNFAAEQSDPGRYRYVIEFQEPRQFGEYAVAVHLDVDGSGDVTAGDYVTTADYSFTGHTPPNRMNVRASRVEE